MPKPHPESQTGSLEPGGQVAVPLVTCGGISRSWAPGRAKRHVPAPCNIQKQQATR